jgi:hypothetical protein
MYFFQPFIASAAALAMTASFGSFARNSSGVVTTHTTTGLAAGTPDPSRYIFAFVYWVSGSAITLSSATIGGITAKVHLQSSSPVSSTTINVSLISALVPTGSTVDIATTFSAANGAPEIYTFPTYNMISDTAIATGSNATAGPTLSAPCNVQAGGIVLIGAMRYPDGSVGSISGASTSYASGAIITSSFSVCGGFYLPLINETPRSLSSTIGSGTAGGNNHFNIVASFR